MSAFSVPSDFDNSKISSVKDIICLLLTGSNTIVQASVFLSRFTVCKIQNSDKN
jgi:hypothetical protein